MIRILIATAFATLFLNNIKAQDLTTAQVDSLINSKHYTFKAERMNPQRGGQKYLTTEYFLRIAGDSLISELPYFGRAYTAPMNPEDVGYSFTSTSFDYTVSNGKKNSYYVTIHTKDKFNNADFILTIYNNGNADLQVTSNNKQLISYTGYLKTTKNNRKH